LGKILHDIPVALNKLLYFISFSIIFFTIVLFFILAAVLISLPLSAFLLLVTSLRTAVVVGE